MAEQLTNPIMVLEWIRGHWKYLKENGTLETAIGKYLKMTGENLTIQDVIDIEESIPEYLKVKPWEE